jgi:hypothetical protein
MIDMLVALALLAQAPADMPAGPATAPTAPEVSETAPAAPAAPVAPQAAAAPAAPQAAATPANANEQIVCKRIRVQTGSRLGRGERVCRPASAWEDEAANAEREGSTIANRIPPRDPMMVP